MRVLRRTVLLTASILAVGSCRENVGPTPSTPARLRTSVNQLRWQPGTTFRAARFVPGAGPDFSTPAATPPALSSYEASFFARMDEDRSVEVDYFAPDATWRPYMVFTVPRGALARRSDGSPFQGSDSVLITASFNGQQLQVGLEPSGLTFNEANPAKLTLWYTGADRDFDADGDIDDTDSYIEQNFLSLWAQQTAGSPWSTVPAEQSLELRSFVADIKHFTGYTLSW